jgi:hypothetical protein
MTCRRLSPDKKQARSGASIQPTKRGCSCDGLPVRRYPEEIGCGEVLACPLSVATRLRDQESANGVFFSVIEGVLVAISAFKSL